MKTPPLEFSAATLNLKRWLCVSVIYSIYSVPMVQTGLVNVASAEEQGRQLWSDIMLDWTKKKTGRGSWLCDERWCERRYSRNNLCHYQKLFRHVRPSVYSCHFSTFSFFISHSSLLLPRDRLSCGGKWKHKQAESALWFYPAALPLITLSPLFTPSLSPSLNLSSLHCFPALPSDLFDFTWLCPPSPPPFFSHHVDLSSQLLKHYALLYAWSLSPKTGFTKYHYWPQVVEIQTLLQLPMVLMRKLVSTDSRCQDQLWTYENQIEWHFFVCLFCLFVFSQNATAQVQLWRWVWR